MAAARGAHDRSAIARHERDTRRGARVARAAADGREPHRNARRQGPAARGARVPRGAAQPSRAARLRARAAAVLPARLAAAADGHDAQPPGADPAAREHQRARAAARRAAAAAARDAHVPHVQPSGPSAQEGEQVLRVGALARGLGAAPRARRLQRAVHGAAAVARGHGASDRRRRASGARRPEECAHHAERAGADGEERELRLQVHRSIHSDEVLQGTFG